MLYIEGDRHAAYRILRAVKNRFGSTNEIGVFEMCRQGLVEVKNPSEFMLSGKPENASGSVVACAMEGTRPMLMEIQALVCRSNFGMPRRTAAGLDYNRVNLLMAVQLQEPAYPGRYDRIRGSGTKRRGPGGYHAGAAGGRGQEAGIQKLYRAGGVCGSPEGDRGDPDHRREECESGDRSAVEQERSGGIIPAAS